MRSTSSTSLILWQARLSSFANFNTTVSYFGKMLMCSSTRSASQFTWSTQFKESLAFKLEIELLKLRLSFVSLVNHPTVKGWGCLLWYYPLWLMSVTWRSRDPVWPHLGVQGSIPWMLCCLVLVSLLWGDDDSFLSPFRLRCSQAGP